MGRKEATKLRVLYTSISVAGECTTGFTWKRRRLVLRNAMEDLCVCFGIDVRIFAATTDAQRGKMDRAKENNVRRRGGRTTADGFSDDFLRDAWSFWDYGVRVVE